MLTEKKRWPASLAAVVATGLMDQIRPDNCLAGMFSPEPARYIAAAGSLRRRKEEVGDAEILYVPRIGLVQKPGEMFASEGSLADAMIEELVRGGKLAKRPNVDGQFTWGPLNKLAIHKATGLPVDLFATTKENWFVSLVIRTGPKDFNIALIKSAKQRGLQLHAYGAFTEIGTGTPIYPKSEREVFELAGMPWLEPEQR